MFSQLYPDYQAPSCGYEEKRFEEERQEAVVLKKRTQSDLFGKGWGSNEVKDTEANWVETRLTCSLGRMYNERLLKNELLLSLSTLYTVLLC